MNLRFYQSGQFRGEHAQVVEKTRREIVGAENTQRTGKMGKTWKTWKNARTEGWKIQYLAFFPFCVLRRSQVVVGWSAEGGPSSRRDLCGMFSSFRMLEFRFVRGDEHPLACVATEWNLGSDPPTIARFHAAK
jgi:hypothetical protein